MTTLAFELACAVVRVWTRMYTSVVRPDLRDRRRFEVDGDLWEAAHDEDTDRSALLLLLRASGGIVDDVRWMVEQPQHVGVLVTAFAGLSVIAVAGWLIVSYSLRVTEMPLPEAARWLARGPFIQTAGPPPPPPPPPPLPRGARRQR